MSKIHLEPANSHLLIRDDPREVTIEGITLPDNVRQQEMVFGTVVAVGLKVWDTKPGDHVCYGPYAGKGVILGGLELRLMLEGQIEGYVREDIVPLPRIDGDGTNVSRPLPRMTNGHVVPEE